MRTFTLAFICLIYSGTTFSINQNPKTWEHGYLFEKKNYNGTTYVYIDPNGKFIWVDDSPSKEVKTIDGVWKRNPINKSLSFYSEDIEDARYLGNSLTVIENGLFKQDQKIPVFKLATENITALMLPQIIEQINTPSEFRELFSIYEINNRQKKYSWEIPTTMENDLTMVLEEIKNNNRTAQNWSNKEYAKSKETRQEWSKIYPKAWDFSLKTFSGIQPDSAKLRAMCIWIEKNIKYDLEFSRAENKTNSPEIIFTNKKGLCLDFARLLNVFCQSQNIPCFDIAGYPIDDIDGKTTSRRDAYHAWNYVKIQGEWLAVDPTWYRTMLSHDHFLIPIVAYQYQHLPDHNVTLANSFAPKNKKEQLRCPVVKQNDMNIIYVGSK
jgi:transglutaminase/protease-like cytokinesis protein 3